MSKDDNIEHFDNLDHSHTVVSAKPDVLTSEPIDNGTDLYRLVLVIGIILEIQRPHIIGTPQLARPMVLDLYGCFVSSCYMGVLQKDSPDTTGSESSREQH